jgi:hypothetical protein
VCGESDAGSEALHRISQAVVLEPDGIATVSGRRKAVGWLAGFHRASPSTPLDALLPARKVAKTAEVLNAVIVPVPTIGTSA